MNHLILETDNRFAFYSKSYKIELETDRRVICQIGVRMKLKFMETGKQ